MSETVYNMAAATTEQNVSLKVDEKLSFSKEETATKFNEAIKPVVEGIEGVDISVAA